MEVVARHESLYTYLFCSPDATKTPKKSAPSAKGNSANALPRVMLLPNSRLALRDSCSRSPPASTSAPPAGRAARHRSVGRESRPGDAQVANLRASYNARPWVRAAGDRRLTRHIQVDTQPHLRDQRHGAAQHVRVQNTAPARRLPPLLAPRHSQRSLGPAPCCWTLCRCRCPCRRLCARLFPISPSQLCAMRQPQAAGAARA